VKEKAGSSYQSPAAIGNNMQTFQLQYTCTHNILLLNEIWPKLWGHKNNHTK